MHDDYDFTATFDFDDSEWKAIDDTTWEFTLREGVKFHDGSDVTAEDGKFSIERIPNVTGPNPTTV